VPAEKVVSAASARGLTIAFAESITGGALVSAVIAVPGASAVVAGGVVAYTVAAKVDVLGVERALIDDAGVVSEEVALAMAERARDLFDADVGVSTTGVAGPEPHGGKVPGTVCMASVGPAGRTSQTFAFAGDRAAIRDQAVFSAMAMLAAALSDRVQNT
jgi:nicotinamide-nucleotide amidase